MALLKPIIRCKCTRFDWPRFETSKSAFKNIVIFAWLSKWHGTAKAEKDGVDVCTKLRIKIYVRIRQRQAHGNATQQKCVNLHFEIRLRSHK